MVKLATTGHMDVSANGIPLVRRALDGLLSHYDGQELLGFSCVAPGADSVFADALLRAGGRLVAVIPSRDYRSTQVGAEHAATYDRLLAAADEVVVMPYESAGRAAYEAANAELLRRAERLVAIWDGSPPTGKGGGTADVVASARAARMPVDVIWPTGTTRASALR
ncbi:hypothetical protein [Streptomyces sp. NPDC050145]|uniref:hypothetical protein n=1 Tax=Streptomyces sp. NPDC050145 TaxID=3365602 RepID=UPI0037A53F5E